MGFSVVEIIISNKNIKRYLGLILYGLSEYKTKNVNVTFYNVKYGICNCETWCNRIVLLIKSRGSTNDLIKIDMVFNTSPMMLDKIGKTKAEE